MFDREEIKQQLFKKNIGDDIGQTGRYLSNISQFFTKKSNPHLRQIIDFETGGTQGETKNSGWGWYTFIIIAKFSDSLYAHTICIDCIAKY